MTFQAADTPYGGAGTYWIAVDGKGAATGRLALSMSPIGEPPNDHFQAAAPIGGESGSVRGEIYGASVQHGEPTPGGFGYGASVWYRWTAPATGTWRFDLHGTQFAAAFGVYSGERVAGLVDHRSSYDASELFVPVRSGVTYSILLNSDYRNLGDLVLNWRRATAPANDRFEARQQLSGSAGSVSAATTEASLELGEPLHGRSSGGASLWYSWTAPATGTLALDTAGSSFDTVLALVPRDVVVRPRHRGGERRLRRGALERTAPRGDGRDDVHRGRGRELVVSRRRAARRRAAELGLRGAAGERSLGRCAGARRRDRLGDGLDRRRPARAGRTGARRPGRGRNDLVRLDGSRARAPTASTPRAATSAPCSASTAARRSTGSLWFDAATTSAGATRRSASRRTPGRPTGSRSTDSCATPARWRCRGAVSFRRPTPSRRPSRSPGDGARSSPPPAERRARRASRSTQGSRAVRRSGSAGVLRGARSSPSTPTAATSTRCSASTRAAAWPR